MCDTEVNACETVFSLPELVTTICCGIRHESLKVLLCVSRGINNIVSDSIDQKIKHITQGDHPEHVLELFEKLFTLCICDDKWDDLWDFNFISGYLARKHPEYLVNRYNMEDYADEIIDLYSSSDDNCHASYLITLPEKYYINWMKYAVKMLVNEAQVYKWIDLDMTDKLTMDGMDNSAFKKLISEELDNRKKRSSECQYAFSWNYIARDDSEESY